MIIDTFMHGAIPIGRILVAGGCGFIGADFVRHERQSDPSLEITNLDALTYAGNPDNLAGYEAHPRYRFVRGDIADRSLVVRLVGEGGFDAIVIGTQCLLDAARAANVPRVCPGLSFDGGLASTVA